MCDGMVQTPKRSWQLRVPLEQGGQVGYFIAKWTSLVLVFDGIPTNFPPPYLNELPNPTDMHGQQYNKSKLTQQKKRDEFRRAHEDYAAN